jgi:peptidoglycan-N-acetylglucosamine deacetylase
MTIARRALLAIGAAVVLPGCAPAPEVRPGTAHPASQPPPSPSAQPVACPTDPEVLTKPGNPQQYLRCDGRAIALTIDDGPHPVWTPKILALLARHKVKATFCMVGENAAAHPDVVAAVVDGGHDIANHTYTHPMNLIKLSRSAIRAEIERTSEKIVAAGGVRPKLVRAPGGTWSLAVTNAATAAGMRPLDWSVDTRDWTRPGVDRIVDTILTRTNPGSIILDHDGGGNRSQTVEALGIALPRLIDEGYHFVQP